MTTIQSFFKTLMAGCVAIAFASCNSGTSTDTTTTTDSTKMDSSKMETTMADTTKPAAAMPAMPAVPFDAAEVTENLKDFAAWKPAFDSNDANRKAAGLEKIVLSQVIDKPNTVQIVYQVTDPQKVKEFYESPAMKAGMQKAGVLSKPQIDLVQVIRLNPDTHEKQWVEVTHKVKNFDAWLKVYDAEGRDKRMSEGMVDAVMARSITDSNVVHLVFDITDMAKAKAAIASPEKKSLMMKAGVMGMPKIVYYKQVE